MARNGEATEWLVVVRRDRGNLYSKLRQSFEPDVRVTVLMDRRLGSRRAGVRGSVASERRQRDRRRPPTRTELGVWETAGSRLVAR